MRRVLKRDALVLLILILFPLSSHSYASSKKGYKDCYNLLLSSKNALPRKSWLRCIDSLERILKRYPNTKRAERSLFREGVLYYNLYKLYGLELDIDMAIKSFRRLLFTYPESLFAPRSLYMIAGIYEKEKNDKKMAYIEYYRLLNEYPKTKFINIAKKKLKELDRYKPSIISGIYTSSKRRALVKSIRYWSNPDYTRVVIDVEEERSFSNRVLKENKRFNKPRRIYFDIKDAKLSKNIKRSISIDDGLIKRIRVSQYSSRVVRVVLDMDRIGTHRIFTLYNPFRIVIDIFRRRGREIPIPGQLSSRVIRRIIIDPGHGGKDPGAIGWGGIKEKDVTLRIAKSLKRAIEKRLGLEVWLTRNDDRFIPLEERTAIANVKRGDLFISIHTNASENRRAHGIETYYLDVAKDEEAIKIAARENALSSVKMSDLRVILNSLIQNSKIIESSRLARCVHESIICRLNGNRKRIKDLGVKQAPFVVLIGSQMPSILIEAGFITNRYDVRRLKDKRFIAALVNSITEGIKRYVREGKLALK